MQRFAHGTWMGFALCALWGCSAPPPPQPAAVPPATADAQLGRIVERYWDDLSRVQSVAPQAVADSLALEKRYLAEVAAIAPGALSAESQLTREVFRRERVLGIEGYTYPAELLPIDPFGGLPQRYAVEAPAALRLAASSPKEFAEWRDRAAAFTQWTQQAILNMREGMRRGYTLPRVSVQKILPQLALLGNDSPENSFYRALGSGPSNAALEDAVKRQILPAYRDLHTFLSREYLPRARQSIALSALPLGEAWYGHLANVATGGARTPVQLHALGLAELERLRARVPAVLAQASFSGNAQSFIEYMRTDPRFSYKSAAALTGAYQDLKGQLAAALPALFSASPRAGFAIRDVEAFRQPVAESLSYRPRSPDGLL
ncbi:MAG: DUF885 domain-containing protein, partial [Pseudomonadota bacterium]|nr:DUF885 domain-containing protein [Pseudomonadota bacterium]